MPPQKEDRAMNSHSFHFTLTVKRPQDAAPISIVRDEAAYGQPGVKAAWDLEGAIAYIRRETLTLPAGTEVQLTMKIVAEE